MASVDLSSLIAEGNPADPQAGPQALRPAPVTRPVGARLAAVPAAGDRTVQSAEASAAAVIAASEIPQPHPPLAKGALTEQEEAELRNCEDAIRTQQLAFSWGVGQALAVISQGQLYRTTHARFDTYVAEVWELSPARAYQLISTWPIARRLAVSTIIDPRRVNEGQLRALTSVVKQHGVDAAVMVYETVAETAIEVDGTKITAKILKDVTEELTAADRLDRTEVEQRVRDYLTKPQAAAPQPRAWDMARGNALRALRQLDDPRADPAEVLAAVTEVRGLLDEIENSARQAASGS